MNHHEVAIFLANNPHFFEEHAELLATVKLSSPLLGRAVSLQERQMEIMRDKYRHLELRLSELLRLAQENDNAITKFQRWTNSLLLAKRDVNLPQLLITYLQEFFSLSHASLRLWNVAKEYEDAWFAKPVSDDLHSFARNLQTPFCGENNQPEAAGWLAAPVSSIALLPLRINEEVAGLFVLASSDKSRYTPDMETHFLSHLADTASAALAFLIRA